MNKPRNVNINLNNYLLRFAKESNIFKSEPTIFNMYEDKSKPKISHIEEGNLKEIEVDGLNAYVKMFDGVFHQNCYLFSDVSHYWQDYLISHCDLADYDKKLMPLIKELISYSLKDLAGACGNIDFFGKQGYYEILKNYHEGIGCGLVCYQPSFLEMDLNLAGSRVIKFVRNYIEENKICASNSLAVSEIKDFVNNVFYRAEQIVGMSRDFYLDSKVERDIVDGKPYYKFMEEEYGLEGGEKKSCNQKDVYDYFENTLLLLEDERKKLIYELDQFENNLFGSENEN